jgi:hypothetical protein
MDGGRTSTAMLTPPDIVEAMTAAAEAREPRFRD